MIRELEDRGFASSTINNYLIPLEWHARDGGTSRGLIPAEPVLAPDQGRASEEAG